MVDRPVEPAGAQVSRRSLLKVGLVGTGVAAIGGVGLAMRGPAMRELPPGLKVFNAKEFSIAAAVADVICPERGQGAPGATAIEVAVKLDGVFSALAPAVQKEAKILFTAFDNALLGFVFERRFTPFSQLSREAQITSLQSWAESGVAFRRTAYLTIRGLCSAMYYGDDRTWERIGYAGPPHAMVAVVRPVRRAKLAEEQRLAIQNSTPEALAAARAAAAAPPADPTAPVPAPASAPAAAPAPEVDEVTP